MQPGHQRGGRQGGKTGESILLLFSRCHAWVQTDYSNNLNHIVQLDVTLCDVVQLNKLLFHLGWATGGLSPAWTWSKV